MVTIISYTASEGSPELSMNYHITGVGYGREKINIFYTLSQKVRDNETESCWLAGKYVYIAHNINQNLVYI